MRKSILALLAVTLAQALWAGGPGVSASTTAELTPGGREVGDLVVNDTAASLYIWTDKVAYATGDKWLLRATVDPNDDYYPYTMFLYRENAATGERVYYPADGTEATDITGRNAAEGYTIAALPQWNKQLLLGPGGSIVNGAMAVPQEAGMYTIVLELRDYTATRVVRAGYAKFAAVTGFVDVGALDVTSDTTWSSDKAYKITDSVFVMPGATLTIQPGTVMLATGQTALLAVTQGARIKAVGTRARPIIWTCGLPAGQRTRGCNGGWVLNGKAVMTRGTGLSEGIEDETKGRYGGNDDDDSSGEIRYVRIEFGGVQFTADNELNGLAFQAVGRKTKIEYVQTHFTADDGFEWFGGTVNAKHLVSTKNGDDSFDWTFGWRGKGQFFLAQQKGDEADQGFECDTDSGNNTATPMSKPTIYNVTLVGNPDQTNYSGSDIGMLFREGTGAIVRNAVVLGFGQEGVRISNAQTFLNANNGDLNLQGSIFWRNNAGDTTFDGQFHPNTVNIVRNFWSRIHVTDPGLRRPFDLNDPDFRPANEHAAALTPGWAVRPPDDGWFDTSADYIGAVPQGVPQPQLWYSEWTNMLDEEELLVLP